jgi:hypothetical protein
MMAFAAIMAMLEIYIRYMIPPAALKRENKEHDIFSTLTKSKLNSIGEVKQCLNAIIIQEHKHFVCSHLSNFSAIQRLSPLLVTRLQIYIYS